LTYEDEQLARRPSAASSSNTDRILMHYGGARAFHNDGESSELTVVVDR
jgi:hypothetical protein